MLLTLILLKYKLHCELPSSSKSEQSKYGYGGESKVKWQTGCGSGLWGYVQVRKLVFFRVL
eukprot:scaffold482_cov98-Skeletonema_dohrnii-CCMP3373.AAC.4